MKINGKKVTEKLFAYDNCHKCYTLKNMKDVIDAVVCDYTILPIEDLRKKYESSCDLKFIHTWDMKKTYVGQFEIAEFED